MILDQLDNGINGVLLTGVFHRIGEDLTVLIQLLYSRKKRFFIDSFFFQNHAESLTFKRTGIENLISAACICGKRNQEIRFAQC